MLKRLSADFISLLFPQICNACGTTLYFGEQLICSSCLHDLPYTDFHVYDRNRVARQFWGRIPLNAAMAMLYFRKAGKVQNLIHNLKYNHKTELGSLLGRLIGARIKLNKKYEDIDFIIPVPLHRKKLRSRGYNQSDCIAKGIAEVLKVKIAENNLIRRMATESQTKKTRYSRYENMNGVFIVTNPAALQGKHILLIDDVLTTGATLEACGNELLKSGIKCLSIAVVAFSDA